MRVIAGRYGGRALRAPEGVGTRPTGDRVREAVFSMLTAAGGLGGAQVLDLFAGSGALGIEALSRGAAGATFVESGTGALKALRANLDSLGLGPPTAEVRPGDALLGLSSAAEAGERFGLVFLDPPYAASARLGPALDRPLERVLESGAWVVCESDRRSPVELDLALERERRYGDTLIRFYRRGDRSR